MSISGSFVIEGAAVERYCIYGAFVIQYTAVECHCIYDGAFIIQCAAINGDGTVNYAGCIIGQNTVTIFNNDLVIINRSFIGYIPQNNHILGRLTVSPVSAMTPSNIARLI